MSERESETENSSGERLVNGLQKMVDEATPDDEHEQWCPTCEQYAEFVVVESVVREEYGVKNSVLGCPDCKYVLVPATQWEPITEDENED